MAAYLIDEKLSFKIQQSLSNESINETDKIQLLSDLAKQYLSVKSLKILIKLEGVNTAVSILHLVRGRKLIFPEYKNTVHKVLSRQFIQA